MVMEYDKGTPTTFIITYMCSRELEKGNGRHYLYIIDGGGRGMVDDIDKKGFYEHYYTRV